MKQKKVSSSLIRDLLIATTPLFGTYKSIIPGVDLATFLLIIAMLYSLMVRRKIQWSHSGFSYVLAYVAFITPMSLALQSIFPSGVENPAITIAFRYLKFVVILLGYMMFIPSHNDSDTKVIEVINAVVYINFSFLLIQWMAYRTGFIIANPFLRFATNEAYDVTTEYSKNMLYRPCAFFFEPSHMAQYCLPYLAYLMFSPQNKGKTRNTMVTGLAILLTGSGIGTLGIVALVALRWITFKKLTAKRVLLFAMAICVVLLMLNTSYVQRILSRVFTANTAYGGNAVEARIGKGYTIWTQLPFIYKIIGTGYGNITPLLYFNGVTYVLNTLGIVGLLILWIILIMGVFCRKELYKKVVELLYFVLLFGSQCFSVGNILYFGVLMGEFHKKRLKN